MNKEPRALCVIEAIDTDTGSGVVTSPLTKESYLTPFQVFETGGVVEIIECPNHLPDHKFPNCPMRPLSFSLERCHETGRYKSKPLSDWDKPLAN